MPSLRFGDASSGSGPQGRADASLAFCVAIHPEVRALDAELAVYGGCARFIMDDGYACGPPSVVFAAVARFGARVRAALGLVLNDIDKLECWSQLHDVTACHHRQHHLPAARVAGLSLPELADIYGRPQHA